MGEASQPSTDKTRYVWLGVFLLVAFVIGSLWAMDFERQPLPLPAVISSVTPRASQQRCAECHAEIVKAFQFAPHARTLSRGNNPEILAAFAGRTYRRPETGVEFRYFERDGQLMVQSSAYARELPIDWVFGSGTHARTPLITSESLSGGTAAIEHAVSWYADGELGDTLGMASVKDTVGILAVGPTRTPAEAINCLGCHCTFVPTDGMQVIADRIEPGVGCARCHWNTAAHVAEMDAGLPSTLERISKLSPRESVDRCGECHRRADELGGPIDPADDTLPRFASVGLVQSPCFQQQSEVVDEAGVPMRFDCTSCHDPHRPTNRDWRHHTRVCLNCHDAGRQRAVDCPQASREENCLTCHMPSVPANDHLRFTDHWIRPPQQSPTKPTEVQE